MSFDSFTQKCDENKIKIIAGDLAEGFWRLEGSDLTRTNATGTMDRIPLSNNLKALDIKDNLKKDDYEPLVGAGIGALVGLRFFGLIGAAAGAFAGHLVTQHQPEFSVKCELADGRKFLAIMVQPMYQKLQGYKKVEAKT